MKSSHFVARTNELWPLWLLLCCQLRAHFLRKWLLLGLVARALWSDGSPHLGAEGAVSRKRSLRASGDCPSLPGGPACSDRPEASHAWRRQVTVASGLPAAPDEPPARLQTALQPNVSSAQSCSLPFPSKGVPSSALSELAALSVRAPQPWQVSGTGRHGCALPLSKHRDAFMNPSDLNWPTVKSGPFLKRVSRERSWPVTDTDRNSREAGRRQGIIDNVLPGKGRGCPCLYSLPVDPERAACHFSATPWCNSVMGQMTLCWCCAR